MKLFWQKVWKRAITSLSTWSMQPEFELSDLTLAQHRMNTDQLEPLAQSLVDRDHDLIHARTEATGLFRRLAELNVRVPGIIRGHLNGQANLQAQLAKVFEVRTGVCPEKELRRARLVTELWKDFDAHRAAQSPPKPPLTVRQQDVEVGRVAGENLYAACEAAQKAQSAAEKNSTNAEVALQSAARRVDRDNKRWYQAWAMTFAAGTPEGNSARSNVPRERSTRGPVALEIATLTAQADGMVRVTYGEQGGQHATTLVLEWQAEGEAEFGHAAPVERAGQSVGPFAAGTTVRFRTRGGNSRRKQVLGGVKEVVVGAGS